MKIIMFYFSKGTLYCVDLYSGPQRLLFARNQALFDTGCGHGDLYTVYYVRGTRLTERYRYNASPWLP